MACATVTSKWAFSLMKRTTWLPIAKNRVAVASFKSALLNNSSLMSRFLTTTSFVNSGHSKNERKFDERKYSDKHEWVSVKDGVGTVGISDYAQESLGEIVYVQLPQVGDSFAMNDEVGALESVKAASEVYAPVTGEIVEKNEKVEETPSLINKSCFEKGWLYKVRLDDSNELKKLMDEEAYREYLKTQAHD